MAKEQRVLSITLVKVDDDGAATFSLELGLDITRSIFMDGKRRGRDPGQWIIDAIALGF